MILALRVVRIDGRWQPQIRRHHLAKFVRHYPDNRARDAIHRKRAPHRRGIGMKAALPQRMADDHRGRSARTVLLGQKVAPHNRLDPQRRQEFPGRQRRRHPLGIAHAADVEAEFRDGECRRHLVE